MLRHWIMISTLAAGLTIPATAQDSQDKALDVQSSMGDLHVGKDADARKAGLPLYPGARLKTDGDNDSPANLSLLTDAFGMKLVVAHYVSEDAPAKVLDFYRDKLKKYGKILECHSEKHNGDISVHDDDKGSNKNKELTCGENTGPVTELKVGTEDNQHLVAVEPGEGNKGTSFSLVYVYTRGQKGEI